MNSISALVFIRKHRAKVVPAVHDEIRAVAQAEHGLDVAHDDTHFDDLAKLEA